MGHASVWSGSFRLSISQLMCHQSDIKIDSSIGAKKKKKKKKNAGDIKAGPPPIDLSFWSFWLFCTMVKKK